MHACVLCGAAGGGKKKRLSMASAVCARGAFAKGSRWEDADVGWEEEKKASDN